jgi:hypothetical protein
MNHMATINVQESTFKAIKQIAERSGSVVAATVERALEQFIATEEMSDEEYRNAWEQLRRDVRAHMPADVTAEEIERDIDAATDVLWAERLAG